MERRKNELFFFSFFPIVVVVFILENGHCMFLFPAHRTILFSSLLLILTVARKTKTKKRLEILCS